MAKHKFKLTGGGHTEGGKDYKAGDVVTSDQNLVALFPNKFEALGPAPSKDEEEGDEESNEKDGTKHAGTKVKDLDPNEEEEGDEDAEPKEEDAAPKKAKKAKKPKPGDDDWKD